MADLAIKSAKLIAANFQMRFNWSELIPFFELHSRYLRGDQPFAERIWVVLEMVPMVTVNWPLQSAHQRTRPEPFWPDWR